MTREEFIRVGVEEGAEVANLEELLEYIDPADMKTETQRDTIAKLVKQGAI